MSFANESATTFVDPIYKHGSEHGSLSAVQRAKSALKDFASCRHGAAAVEAAFVLPVLFAGLFIAIEFGRIFYSKVEFEYAFSSAVRSGMVQKVATKATMTTALKNSMITLDPLNVTSTSFAETQNVDNTKTADWSASYRIDLIAPVTSQKSVTVSKATSFLRAP